MNNVREKLKTLPSKAVTKILKRAFVLPTPAARFFVNDLTKPRKSHLPWTHKVKLDPNGPQQWHGCWIGKDVRKLSKDALLQRIHDADLILFYVHGGGFRVGSSTMYMDTTISWLKALKKKHNINTMIMSVDYRLAPEHRYPSAVEDVVHAYQYLIQQLNVSSKKIVVIGDQAGASLLLETLFITHDPNMFEITAGDECEPVVPELPRPAGIVFISPLVTDQITSESWRVNQKYDYITEYTAKVTIKDYFEPIREELLDEEEQSAQRILGVLKLHTGFSEFLSKDLLMYVGNLEVFRDDALLLASKAEQDGINCQIVMENYVHNWFCVRDLVKDKLDLKRADDTLADFCARVTGKEANNDVPARKQEYLDSISEEEEDDSLDSNNTEYPDSLLDDLGIRLIIAQSRRS